MSNIFGIPSETEIDKKISSFERIHPLPGIQTTTSRSCFIKQIIDSIRRIKFVEVIRESEHSAFYADASDERFDPLKAAVWYKKRGNLDEAFWLVFLSIHFGKNIKTGWGLTRNVYGGLGHPMFWDWPTVSSDPAGFRQWLHVHIDQLKSTGIFANHRKYQSLKAFNKTGTGATVSSYIDWVGADHNHQIMIDTAIKEAGSKPDVLFDYLYGSMSKVIGFGRMGKFDYLTMVGKLKLAEIEPGSTYLQGATGPYDGAKLLFGQNDVSRPTLDSWLREFGEHLDLYFAMQILEDAIFNWQKNPRNYQRFRG